MQKLVEIGQVIFTITNMVQDRMMSEVPVDSINMHISFLQPRIGCAGEEGKDTEVHQDKTGNALGKLHGRTVRRAQDTQDHHDRPQLVQGVGSLLQIDTPTQRVSYQQDFVPFS